MESNEHSLSNLLMNCLGKAIHQEEQMKKRRLNVNAMCDLVDRVKELAKRDSECQQRSDNEVGLKQIWCVSITSFCILRTVTNLISAFSVQFHSFEAS